jgi:hypothetical protein
MRSAQPGHDAHTVHLAVHPSAWSSPLAPEESHAPPTVTTAPVTPGTPYPGFGGLFASAPLHSPFLSAFAPPTPSPLPTQASVAKDYVMFHHTNALRVMAGQPLEPWASPWSIEQTSAAYWAYMAITNAGYAFPSVLTMPYPPQSAGEVGLEYTFVTIELVYTVLNLIRGLTSLYVVATDLISPCPTPAQAQPLCNSTP